MEFYNYQLAASEQFKKDLVNLKKQNSKLKGKVLDLLIDMAEDPFKGIGNPEALKGDLSGCWSRRIDQKHRLVYQVDEDSRTIYLLSSFGHYGDK